jgi:hypothetical protein
VRRLESVELRIEELTRENAGDAGRA